MSETKYESKIVSSASSAASIFRVVSDLSNLEKVRPLIPEDKVKELECSSDFIRFKVDGLGQKVGIRLLEKEDGNYVKYGAENVPVEAYFWIQMKEVAPADTRIKLTVKADMPMMFKMMLEKKLQEGLDKAADMIAQMPFDNMA